VLSGRELCKFDKVMQFLTTEVIKSLSAIDARMVLTANKSHKCAANYSFP